MNLKFELILLFFGGVIRLVVIITNIWYLSSQDIGTNMLWYIGLCSLIAPACIMFLVYSVTLIKECLTKEISSTRVQVVLLFVIGDSLGLNYFVFTFILCYSEFLSGDFYVVDAMFRSAALINTLFQSMPQIIYQAYNNQIYNNWEIFSVFSIGMTCLSLVYTIVKLAHAIDKVQQFTSAISKSETSTHRTHSTNKVSSLDMIATDNNQEIYPESIS